MWYNTYMSRVLKNKLEYVLNDECTKQEEDVLRFLYENEALISTLTAKEVAEKCFCSTSAVNRAVKKMGFDGYFEFKIFSKFYNNLEKQQGKSKNKFSSYINMILDDIDYNQIVNFANVINESEIIYVYGNGVSNISSLFLFRQLLNLDYNAIYIPDLDLLNKVKHGTIVCISNLGMNDHVNYVLKKSRAKIISITKDNSDLAKLSEVSLSHQIDYSNATELEREQQIQTLLIIGALVDNLN